MVSFICLQNIYALKSIKGIGKATINKLLSSNHEAFESELNIECLFGQLNELQFCNLGSNFKNAFNQSKSDVKNLLHKCEQLDIKIIVNNQNTFPEYLKATSDAPTILFIKGELNCSKLQKSISIVGTRKCSEYGSTQTKKYSKYFAEKDYCIVSGLALGVDAISHQEALKSNGYCIAVLGCGVDIPYPPNNWRIYEEIIAKGGAIISEFEPGTEPKRENFPMRNRIIAGLTKATVVIEAAQKSGSLITAKLAFDYDRMVFALPADVTRKNSQGCNELIRSNIAKLTFEPSDILEELEDTLENKSTSSVLQTAYDNYAEGHKLIINYLIINPSNTDKISEDLGIEITPLNTILTELELDEVITKDEEGKWRVR